MGLKVSIISHFFNCIKEDAILGFPCGSVVKNLPAMLEPQEMGVQSLGQEDPLRDGNPLQYSCLENPIDRGDWQAIVYSVAKSWTQLKQLSTHAFLFYIQGTKAEAENSLVV